MSRIFVARDHAVFTPEAQRLVNEARAALPALRHDASEELLPPRPLVGRCRICGEERPLTREHIPPGSAYNLERGRIHTILDWLRRAADGVMPGGILRQGGNWGYTLCESCNNLTGARYADEYRELAMTVVRMFAGTNVRELKGQAEQPIARFALRGDAEHPGPRPGALVREILSLMCSLSADFDLAGRYPAIRRLILGPSIEPLPNGMSLGMTVYLGGHPRYAGPTLTVEPDAGVWRWVMEVAHPPIATLMVLATNGHVPHVCDLSAFTQLAPDARAPIEGRIAIGFGYTPMPGDYRTRAMVEAEATA